MDSLAKTLERFNRKERNVLVRAILGHEEKKPLLLSTDFRQQVTDALAFPEIIPADAWWGTDYHISWLAGALAVFMKGEEALQERSPFLNPRVKPPVPCPVTLQGKGRQLIEGNQEDIDLVIATEHHLVLIEAKAYGAFSNKQMASKLERLNLLHDFYQKLKLASEPDRVVCFHLLLLSPYKPKRLAACWPSWACKDSKVPWIKLRLTWPVLEVTRCDEHGASTDEGAFWRVIEQNRTNLSRCQNGRLKILDRESEQAPLSAGRAGAVKKESARARSR